MKIDCWLTPTAADRAASPPAGLAVVIDVLRATTVTTTALAAGAARVLTTRTVDQAIELADKIESQSGTRPLLCGERHCRPIDGFDLGNSPGEYNPAKLHGRVVVQTTTNGTAAIAAASSADQMILACFANLSAVVDRIAEFAGEGIVRLVAAGTDGGISTEDILCAGAIIGAVHRQLGGTERFYDGPLELHSDEANVALAMWQHALTHRGVIDGETLATVLANTAGGRNLIAAGYTADLTDCASIDVLDVVPRRVAVDPPTFVSSTNGG